MTNEDQDEYAESDLKWAQKVCSEIRRYRTQWRWIQPVLDQLRGAAAAQPGLKEIEGLAKGAIFDLHTELDDHRRQAAYRAWDDHREAY